MKIANPRRTIANIRRIAGSRRSGISGARSKSRGSALLTRLLLLLFAAVILPMTGRGEDLSSQNANAAMPHCGSQSDGQVYCKFGVLYECQLNAQNSLDRRTGWRWKADLLRTCAEPAPANMDNRRYLLPEVICESQRPNHNDQQGDRGDAGAAGEGIHEREMYIRPSDCPQLNH